MSTMAEYDLGCRIKQSAPFVNHFLECEPFPCNIMKNDDINIEITSGWLLNRFLITCKSLDITLESLANHFRFNSETDSNHFRISYKSHSNYLRITSESIPVKITFEERPNHFLITSESLRNHYRIISESLLNHFWITSKSLPNHFQITFELFDNCDLTMLFYLLSSVCSYRTPPHYYVSPYKGKHIGFGRVA